MEQHHVVRAGAPARAQARVAPCGIEQRGVDAARDHAHALEAERRELRAHRLGRHHRAQRAVMEFAQVGEDRLLQPADAVVRAVGVEVGPEVGHHGQLELRRRLQRRPAERALGHDVHHVRALEAPQPGERALRRQPDLEVGVARNRDPSQKNFFVAEDDRRSPAAAESAGCCGRAGAGPRRSAPRSSPRRSPPAARFRSPPPRAASAARRRDRQTRWGVRAWRRIMQAVCDGSVTAVVFDRSSFRQEAVAIDP